MNEQRNFDRAFYRWNPHAPRIYKRPTTRFWRLRVWVAKRLAPKIKPSERAHWMDHAIAKVLNEARKDPPHKHYWVESGRVEV